MNTIIANPQQIQTVSNCLKTTENFSQTIYQNVCDGTSYIVTNGFWDYMGLFLLSGIGIGFVLMLLAFIFVFIKG